MILKTCFKNLFKKTVKKLPQKPPANTYQPTSHHKVAKAPLPTVTSLAPDSNQQLDNIEPEHQSNSDSESLCQNLCDIEKPIEKRKKPMQYR